VVWKWTDSLAMDCPDVCLKALWLQEWEWVLEDCHKRSCWKYSIGVSVPRPCGSDVYVCSESFGLCLTVVYWLFVVQWSSIVNRTPEYVTISYWTSKNNVLPDVYSPGTTVQFLEFHLTECKLSFNHTTVVNIINSNFTKVSQTQAINYCYIRTSGQI
jgi:hypothetical protein